MVTRNVELTETGLAGAGIGGVWALPERQRSDARGASSAGAVKRCSPVSAGLVGVDASKGG